MLLPKKQRPIEFLKILGKDELIGGSFNLQNALKCYDTMKMLALTPEEEFNQMKFALKVLESENNFDFKQDRAMLIDYMSIVFFKIEQFYKQADKFNEMFAIASSN